ncbi:MAG: hypothetical protein V7K14_14770 [Nostoc sp.]|uniref:hypothetical protein n=1 Tax=Nostoc sp. TaxID=1180 RepID=UPI002FFB31AB
MNLVALPTVAILVKKAIAICPDAKINLLTQIFNKSDALLYETLRVACFHEVVRRRCYPELVEGIRVTPTAVNYTLN